MRDLTGQRFGRLVAVRCVGSRLRTGGRHDRLWVCTCDCGAEVEVITDSLRSGNDKSCGCLIADASRESIRQIQGKSWAVTHGGSYTPAYQSWQAMKTRCLNPNAEKYPDYGGRGIVICRRWLGKHGFENFRADMGERPAGKTLDRRNVNGNYTPRNCRWATAFEQVHNRRKAA